MKKIIANAHLCVLLCTATACKEQTNIYIANTQKKLFTYQDASSAAKRITEDISNKIYTEKGTITGI